MAGDILSRTWLGIGEKTGGVLFVVEVSATYSFGGKIEIY